MAAASLPAARRCRHHRQQRGLGGCGERVARGRVGLMQCLRLWVDMSLAAGPGAAHQPVVGGGARQKNDGATQAHSSEELRQPTSRSGLIPVNGGARGVAHGPARIKRFMQMRSGCVRRDAQAPARTKRVAACACTRRCSVAFSGPGLSWTGAPWAGRCGCQPVACTKGSQWDDPARSRTVPAPRSLRVAFALPAGSRTAPSTAPARMEVARVTNNRFHCGSGSGPLASRCTSRRTDLRTPSQPRSDGTG